MLHFGRYFTATQRILIGSQIGEWVVKEHLKLHLLHIYHIVIQLVLATVPVLDPAGNIGLRGNGLTPSKIDDFLSEPSL